MNSHFRIDRDILISVGTAAISTIGICLVLALGLHPAPEPEIVVERTATPFQYQLLATETYTPDPSLVTENPEFPFEAGTTDPSLPPTDESGLLEPPLSFPTLPEDTESLETDTTPEATDEPIETEEPVVDEEVVFVEGIYDDTDPRIEYIGDWTSELFVDNAHEETLNVSTSMGNTASFTFVGRQIVLGYLGSADVDLGSATIAIDGNPYQLNQAAGNAWTSPQLSFGEHTVVITHQTGDLLFLDYIDVSGSS